MSTERSATTPELRGINEVANEHVHLGVTAEGVAQLDPNGTHYGTLIVTTTDVGQTEDHGGAPVRADAWFIVCWVVRLIDGSQGSMLIGCLSSAYLALPPTTFPAEIRREVHAQAMRSLRDVADSGILLPTADGRRAPLRLAD